MTYSEATGWLFSRTTQFHNTGAAAYKPGLERVRALCHAFGDPHLKLRCIHVAGTNGKGSTSSLLASVLAESGYTTGLFTSPHLLDFRERIRVNGVMISEEGVVDFIERYRAMDLGLEPSFFELTTVMAFDWFARRGCDRAVIEVGLGGRLDSTNIITPELSIITNISLDHTDLLGDTEAKIAGEKAGIIKPGVPVVIGYADREVRRVFEQAAMTANAPVTFAQESKWAELVAEGVTDTYKTPGYGQISDPLTGSGQQENANTVVCAMQVLADARVDAAAVQRGFARVLQNTWLMGRWTTLSRSPLTICDTGHNPGGWQGIAPLLHKIAVRGTLHMVVGFVNDKDITKILAMMPMQARYYFCKPSVARGRDAAQVAAVAATAGLTGGVYDTVAQAWAAARRQAHEGDTIFIGGSTFVVADALAELSGR